MSSTDQDWWTQHSSDPVQALWGRLTEALSGRVGVELATRYEKQSVALANAAGQVLLRAWPRSDSIRFGLWHQDDESAIARLAKLGFRPRRGPVDKRFRFTLPSDASAEVRESVLDLLEECIRGLDAEASR